MNTIGQREFLTQRRVISFFQLVLGYNSLGNWKDRTGNRNIEDKHLIRWLKDQGHSDKIIERALSQVRKAAD